MWSIGDFDMDDETNRLIWETSPQILKKIHGLLDANTNKPKFNGQVGVQQAMFEMDGTDGFDKEPLPLVPDLVGKDTGKNAKRAVLVLGSSYAPFIKNISWRDAIAHSDYRIVRSAGEFQQLFFSKVINGDTSYYSVLESRLKGIRSPRELIVTDLCRGSFCRRDNQRLRRDMGGDSVVNGSDEARSLFSHYVDEESDWTWQRIQSVGDIVTLGIIAEYGVLRLFNKKNVEVRMNGSELLWANPFHDNDYKWMANYAQQGKTLQSWLEPGAWWNARARIGNREWRVLPTYHPAGRTSKNELRQCEKLKHFLIS
jgi:hypothetical protein